MDPKKRRLATIGTILAICLFGFFFAIPLFSGFFGRFVPHGVQDPVGREVVDAARGDARYCNDPAGLAALDSLVDRLDAATDHPAPFRVYVVDDDTLNAFAAPGGHIVVFREIIEQAHDPEEFAGVLAHEMAHEIEHHPASGLVETVGYGIFSLLTPGGGDLGSEVAATIVTSKFSRDDELEADRGGVALLNAAGVDSRGLARFFDTMSEQGGDIPGALEFLSTHPTGDRRQSHVADVQREGAPALDAAAWAALRKICASTTSDATAVGT